ncbi:hypothetical protein XELAEV_18011923mg [Xenopus laevis]|uniref:Uncharacterized protein n=1 Tax=Xenopus laevis TaxID=8355 RepID=A0A974DMS3_XENLA|nr:hypothetical protein XELAEV_18011923mg [Xenopus laevis]
MVCSDTGNSARTDMWVETAVHWLIKEHPSYISSILVYVSLLAFKHWVNGVILAHRGWHSHLLGCLTGNRELNVFLPNCLESLFYF